MGEHELGIHEFLLGFVLSAEVPGGSEGLAGTGEPRSVVDLRAEIERHHDRPDVVGSDQGTHGTPRCGTCADYEDRPCMALRLLAVAYAPHPAYRSEWLPMAGDIGIAQPWSAGRFVGEALVPRQRAAVIGLSTPGSTLHSTEPRQPGEPID